MDIKKLRKKKGWSQLQLASKVGVSSNTVRNWEYGATPKKENYKKLQEVLLDEKTGD